MLKQIYSVLLAVAVLLSSAAFGGIQAHAHAGGYRTVAAGSGHSLAIMADGSLWAWGQNNYGQVGDGDANVEKTAPVKIMDDVAFIAAGWGHSLAIKTDGSLWAWGRNMFGQLGTGSNENSSVPVKIMDDVAFVATSNENCLAVKTDGSLWAWGQNANGQVGNGTKEITRSPVKVMDGAVSAAAGWGHSLAIKTDGSLWAWGFNEFGQLGDGKSGDGIHCLKPVKIMDDVASVAAGTIHSMAIKTDGSLWTWGFNTHGQLGNGTLEMSDLPVKVMDDAAKAAAGDYHSFAIKTDGSLWAWGYNHCGQLGDGTVTVLDEVRNIVEDNNKLVPSETMKKVSNVAAGDYYGLAVKTDGSLWAWGDNKYGQLGDGTITTYNEEWQIDEDNNKPSPVNIGGGTRINIPWPVIFIFVAIFVVVTTVVVLVNRRRYS
ncbi:MAG: hypothetical protein FWG42_08945 [Clostridiales bacterium]|nr:hypothetical protein [Clostridiales bacterium]